MNSEPPRQSRRHNRLICGGPALADGGLSGTRRLRSAIAAVSIAAAGTGTAFALPFGRVPRRPHVMASALARGRRFPPVRLSGARPGRRLSIASGYAWKPHGNRGQKVIAASSAMSGRTPCMSAPRSIRRSEPASTRAAPSMHAQENRAIERPAVAIPA